MKKKYQSFKFTKEEGQYLHFLFDAASRAMKLDRKRRRHVMKLGNRFKKIKDHINLEKPEILFTQNILAINMSALTGFVKTDKSDDSKKHEQAQAMLNICTKVYNYLKGPGE